jgi:DNA polymerase I-like protein with 3'-5' exonuclease and polymerase domains/uracil-DNA glycosylase
MARTIHAVGPKNARIMIIGDAPTLPEVKFGHPFAGDGGEMLNLMLQKVGISRTECYLTTVIKTRVVVVKNGREFDDPSALFAKTKKEISPTHQLINGKWVKGELADALAALGEEINSIRPNVILACGNVALWALTGQWGVSDWRGSLERNELGYECKVIPTIHPAAVVKNLDWRVIVIKDYERAKREMVRPEFPVLVEKFHIEPTFALVTTWLSWMETRVRNQVTKLAMDIENPGGYIDTIGFAWTPQHAIVIPFWNKERMKPYWSLDEEAEIMFRLYKLMTHQNFHGICQNGMHELQYIEWQWMFTANVKKDTMVDHHAMVATGSLGDESGWKKSTYTQAKKKDLGFLSSYYRKDHRYWKNALDEYQTQQEYWTYNARDCVATFDIHLEQEKRIDVIPRQRFVSDCKNALVSLMHKVAAKGIKVDEDRKKELRGEWVRYISIHKEWLDDVVGFSLNLSSPKQLQDFFYKQLGQQVVKVRKGMDWKPSVSADALIRIGQNEPLLKPITSTIVDIWETERLIKSLFESSKVIKGGRLHSAYNVASMATDGLVSGSTSFGHGHELVDRLMYMLEPDEGKVLDIYSFEGKETRIVGFESGSDGLKIRSPYAHFAQETSTEPWIMHEMISSINSMEPMAETLRRTSLTATELNKLSKWYTAKCPEIIEWHRKIRSQVISRGYVENIFGRRYYFTGERNDKKVREAIGWVVNSTLAWVVNVCLLRIERDLGDVEIMGVFGTDIILQYPEKTKDEVRRKVMEKMTVTLPYNKEPLAISPVWEMLKE